MLVSSLTLNDGTQTPWMAFGTGTALSRRDVANNVTIAIQNGFTHLDSAQLYGNETSLGAGIVASGKPRSEMYITTKLGSMAPGETPKSALMKSLKRLGVGYVDMYLIHKPFNHPGKLGEVWKGMEEAKAAGLTKSIGVSNFAVDHLRDVLEVATVIPAVNQIEAHPYVWNALRPCLALHRKYGIVTSAYAALSPITQGRGGPLDPVIEEIRVRLEKTRGSRVSAGQVLCKWLKQKGSIVVTTSSKAERIREYIDTENVPDLTLREIEQIEIAGAKLHKSFWTSGKPPEHLLEYYRLNKL